MIDNLPEVTRIIKSMLGDDYNYDSTVSSSDFWLHHHSVFSETSKIDGYSMRTEYLQSALSYLHGMLFY